MARQGAREARLHATMQVGGLSSVAATKVVRDRTQSGDPILAIDLAFEQVADGNIRQLAAEEEQIESLTLTGTQVTDRGLAYLRKLPRLRSLSLSKTSVTDGGCEILAEITTLESLSLSDTAVTDQGIRCLRNLTNLEWLDIRNTAVTDLGLATLERFDRLATLNIAETKVTEQGVATLREKLPSLEQVSGLVVKR